MVWRKRPTDPETLAAQTPLAWDFIHKTLKSAPQTNAEGYSQQYFHITFDRQHEDVVLPKTLGPNYFGMENFAMRYERLAVGRQGFAVTRKNHQTGEDGTVVVPFDAITRFTKDNPKVEFTFQDARLTASNVDVTKLAARGR